MSTLTASTPSTMPTPLPLEPMIMPDAIGWWPFAWGWWVIVGISLAALVALILMARYYWRRRAPIRYARQQLAQQHQAILRAPDTPTQHFIQYCNTVMKQVCLHYHPHAVHLSGGAWLAFLQRHSRYPIFEDEYARIIAQGAYQPDCQCDITELYQRTDQWLKQLSMRTQNTDQPQALRQQEVR